MFEAYLDGEKVGEEYLTPISFDYESGNSGTHIPDGRVVKRREGVYTVCTAW